MSLRDINVIYENFRMFFVANFANRANHELSLPYLIMMILKYKEPYAFTTFSQGKIYDEVYLEHSFVELKPKYKKLLGGNANKPSSLLIQTKPMMPDGVQSVTNKEGKILVKSNNYLVECEANNFVSPNIDSSTDERFYTYEDLAILYSMGDLTLTPAQYIARRIEMFS